MGDPLSLLLHREGSTPTNSSRPVTSPNATVMRVSGALGSLMSSYGDSEEEEDNGGEEGERTKAEVNNNTSVVKPGIL